MKRLVAIARTVGPLVAIELFVPGGTLIVVGLLGTRWAVPGLSGIADRLSALWAAPKLCGRA